MSQKVTIKTVGIVILITVFTKFLGFTRELVLAYFYSASVISDAYLLSSDIVSILFGWVLSFSVVFTPVFNTALIQDGKRRALDYTRKILTIITILSILAIIITEIMPGVIVSMVGHGLSEPQKIYVVKFLRIIIFSIGFNALSELFVSYLNLNESHIIANVVGLPFNIIEIISISISVYCHNPMIMAFGVVGGNLSKCLVALIASVTKGMKYVNLHIEYDSYIKQTWVMFIPIYCSNMLVEINTLIDKAFASYLPEGSLTLLNYGAVSRRFIFNVFSIVITSIFFPIFSRLVIKKGNYNVGDVVEKTINSAVVIFIPISFLVIIYSEDIIRFLFNRGALKGETDNIASIFAFYCVGLTPMIINEICSKIVYSFKNSKLPLYTGIITIAFNCVFNYVFIKIMQTPGLAFATSLSQLIISPAFLFLIHKKECSIKFKVLLRNLFEIFIVNGILFAIFYYIKKLEYFSTIRSRFGLLFAMAESIIFLALYIVIMFILKNRAIKELFFYFRRRR